MSGARRARAAGGRADLDRRSGGQHRRRPGLHARQPDPGDRPGRAHRPRRAGRGLRRRARRRRAARADVRPRPVHAQPLHPRRDDRQQRVRVALGGVGQDRRQRRRPGRAHLPRRAAVAGGGRDRRHPRQTLDPGSPARAGRADGRRRPRRLSRPHPPRLRLQPGPAAARPGRPRQGAGRHRGHVRGAHRGDGPACRIAARPRAGRARLPGRLHRGGPRDGRPCPEPADHRGDGRRPDRGAAREQSGGDRVAPAARGWGLALRRDRRRDARRGARGRGRRRGGHEALRALGAGGERTDADEGAVADPGGRRRDPDPLTGRRRGVAGLGGRRGAAGAVRRLPA